MTNEDLITVLGFAFGLILIIVAFLLIKRYKLKIETWPLIFGFGIGVYAFASFMILSITSRPLSEILDYAVTNIILSLALGVTVFFSVRMGVRSKRKNK